MPNKRSNASKRRGNGAAPQDQSAPLKNGDNAQTRQVTKAVAGSLVDYSLILSLVFGGCCANVWSYEQILKLEAHVGTALTFSQMLFITLHSLPAFLTRPPGASIPRLKPRQVPLSRWALQVLVFTFGTLLNNWAFAFRVPLTVQIVFRSAGLAVSMLFGFLFLKRRYSLPQIAVVLFVSAGVILATLSRPSSKSDPDVAVADYAWGILVLALSSLLTAVLGVLQERTYSTYGPCWKEGVFYTHFLSLPIFLFFVADIKRGFRGLAGAPVVLAADWPRANAAAPYLVLLANLCTQLLCVSGVNQLTSRVTSVTTNLVLTARKALSLCFSVWWFGNGWNAQLGVGAGMVFVGSALYPVVSAREPPTPAHAQKKRAKKNKAE